MPKRKVGLLDSIRIRLAVRKDRRGSRRMQTKRTMTLMLGAALSIGGITQGLNNVHFLVEKDLDQVKVVRSGPDGERSVTTVGDSFAANSLYKLSALAPKSLVARRSTLFASTTWFPLNKEEARAFGREIGLLPPSVREEFFRTGMPYGDLIHQKAAKYDVDPALVAAVIEAESRFKHRARSQVGARGLMQLMPRTGRWMGAKDLYDPAENVDAGARYLKYLSERFDGNLTKTIAAYNAGEGNVRRFNGVPPYSETRTYVKRVMKNYQKRNEQLKSYQEKLGETPVLTADSGR